MVVSAAETDGKWRLEATTDQAKRLQIVVANGAGPLGSIILSSKSAEVLRACPCGRDCHADHNPSLDTARLLQNHLCLRRLGPTFSLKAQILEKGIHIGIDWKKFLNAQKALKDWRA